MYVLVLTKILAIDVLYSAPTTTQIAYAAGRRRRPTVHLQHQPQRLLTFCDVCPCSHHNCGDRYVVPNTHDDTNCYAAGRRCICNANRNDLSQFWVYCGDRCVVPNTHDDTNCLRYGPSTPPDGAFAAPTATMWRLCWLSVLRSPQQRRSMCWIQHP